MLTQVKEEVPEPSISQRLKIQVYSISTTDIVRQMHCKQGDVIHTSDGNNFDYRTIKTWATLHFSGHHNACIVDWYSY
jgi:hypothetical protein